MVPRLVHSVINSRALTMFQNRSQSCQSKLLMTNYKAAIYIVIALNWYYKIHDFPMSLISWKLAFICICPDSSRNFLTFPRPFTNSTDILWFFLNLWLFNTFQTCGHLAQVFYCPTASKDTVLTTDCIYLTDSFLIGLSNISRQMSLWMIMETSPDNEALCKSINHSDICHFNCHISSFPPVLDTVTKPYAKWYN